jgi:hypothetical protein
MPTRQELAAELLKTAEAVGHPHVEMDVPEHDDLRLRLMSDDGPRWALEVAAGFSRTDGWRIREVSSQGGQLFILWLTVERDEGRPA